MSDAYKKSPYVLHMRGTADYRETVKKVAEKGGYRSIAHMMESLIEIEAKRLKVKLAPRANPWGTNRHSDTSGKLPTQRYGEEST